MTLIRRFVFGLLVLVGIVYVFRAASTLAELRSTTDSFIASSNDRDFVADYNVFFVLIGLTAAGFLLLGAATAFYGVNALRDAPVRWRPWAALAWTACLLHVLWLLYRRIGAGILPQEQAMSRTLTSAAQLAVVCVLYMAGYLLARRERKDETP